MADQHRLHALRTVLMAASLTLALLAAHALDRLTAWLPSPAAAIPATSTAAAVTTRCVPVRTAGKGHGQEVTGRA
jgi:hypothetical protein